MQIDVSEYGPSLRETCDLVRVIQVSSGSPSQRPMRLLEAEVRGTDLSEGSVGARPTRAGQWVVRMVSHGFTHRAEEFSLEFGGTNHGQVMSGQVLQWRRGLYVHCAVI